MRILIKDAEDILQVGMKVKTNGDCHTLCGYGAKKGVVTRIYTGSGTNKFSIDGWHVYFSSPGWIEIEGIENIPEEVDEKSIYEVMMQEEIFECFS